MIKAPVFVRVVSQDKQRGYTLLVGYDKSVVQRTAVQQITLSNLTRASLAHAIGIVKTSYSASMVHDVTAPGIAKKLEKIFAEQEAPAVTE